VLSPSSFDPSNQVFFVLSNATAEIRNGNEKKKRKRKEPLLQSDTVIQASNAGKKTNQSPDQSR
jgi:hypothetical protein